MEERNHLCYSSVNDSNTYISQKSDILGPTPRPSGGETRVGFPRSLHVTTVLTVVHPSRGPHLPTRHLWRQSFSEGIGPDSPSPRSRVQTSFVFFIMVGSLRAHSLTSPNQRVEIEPVYMVFDIDVSVTFRSEFKLILGLRSDS